MTKFDMRPVMLE